MDACLSCFLYGFPYRKSLKMWYNEVLEKQVSLAWKGNIMSQHRFTIHLVNFISVLPTQLSHVMS